MNIENIENNVKTAIFKIKSAQNTLENNPLKTIHIYKLLQSCQDKLVNVLREINAKE